MIETSSYLLNGNFIFITVNVNVNVNVTFLMVWISATNVTVPVGLNEKLPIELKSYFGIR